LRRKHVLLIALTGVICVLYITVSFANVGKPGTTEDPFVTLSYIKNVYLPGVERDTTRITGEKFATAAAAAGKFDISTVTGFINTDTLSPEFANRLFLSGRVEFYAPFPRVLTLKKGMRIFGLTGTQLIVRSGTVKGHGPTNSVLINLTSGKTTGMNITLPANMCYMIGENTSAGFMVESETASVLLQGKFRITSTLSPYQSINLRYADALNSIGVFMGTGSGYALERAATRDEAITLFVKLLGKGNEALAITKKTHPFTDVDGWANPFISYAYSKGFTAGVGDNKYGSKQIITPNEFLTFCLRSLGYDIPSDFQWTEALNKAVEVGLLTPSQMRRFKNGVFYRDQIVEICWHTLVCRPKNGSDTLLDRFVSQGIITRVEANAAIKKAG